MFVLAVVMLMANQSVSSFFYSWSFSNYSNTTSYYINKRFLELTCAICWSTTQSSAIHLKKAVMQRRTKLETTSAMGSLRQMEEQLKHFFLLPKARWWWWWWWWWSKSFKLSIVDEVLIIFMLNYDDEIKLSFTLNCHSFHWCTV